MPPVRISQHPVQLFVQSDSVGITQHAVELFIHEEGNIQVTQQAVEIFQEDYYTQDIVSSGVQLHSWLEFDTGPDPRDKWLVDDTSKKIYLIRIELRRIIGGVVVREYIYASNFAFNTHPNEDPPNKRYRTILLDSNIPPLVQKLSEVFYGISTPSYGQLILYDVKRELNNYLPPSYAWDGGEIYIRLTGDRQELPLVYALDILYGQLGIVKFGENQIQVDIYSKHRQLEKKKIAEGTFKGLNDEDITERIPYGICKNIEGVLIDDIDLIYRISTVEIESVDDAFDDGVQISPDDYEVDLVAGTVQLLVNPAGKVTFDVHGKKINGAFSALRGDFIRDAMEQYGKVPAGTFIENSFLLFNTAVSGDSGIYVTATIPVLQFVTDLLLPVLGYLIIDRFGRISLGIMEIPDGSGEFDIDISETNMLPISGGRGGDSDASLEGSFYEVETLSRIINKAILLYDQNNTVQDESTLGDDAPVATDTPEGREKRAWLKEEWRKVIVPLLGELSLLYELCSEPQEDIPSYFLNRSDAEFWGVKWVQMFGFDRRIVHIKTKIEPLQFTIGAKARLTVGGNVIGFGTVIGYREDYADSSVITDFLV